MIMLLLCTLGSSLIQYIQTADINTETFEGLWMLAKRKLRYQSGTSRRLFASYLGAFLWRHSHKQNVFGCYLQMLCANYQI